MRRGLGRVGRSQGAGEERGRTFCDLVGYRDLAASLVSSPAGRGERVGLRSRSSLFTFTSRASSAVPFGGYSVDRSPQELPSPEALAAVVTLCPEPRHAQIYAAIVSGGLAVLEGWLSQDEKWGSTWGNPRQGMVLFNDWGCLNGSRPSVVAIARHHAHHSTQHAHDHHTQRKPESLCRIFLSSTHRYLTSAYSQ